MNEPFPKNDQAARKGAPGPGAERKVDSRGATSPRGIPWRAGAALALMVAGALILGGVAWKAWQDARFFSGYRPGAPLNVQEGPAEPTDAGRRVRFVFGAGDGGAVPGVLYLPRDGQAPWPCVVFLHGIGQSGEFVGDIAAPFTEAGFAIASFDQYMRGARRLDDPGALEEAIAFRQRAARTVADTHRLLDYLEARDDIAGDRLYLLGASYGAITGVSAAAFDPRLRAVVLTYGGGGVAELLRSEAVRGELGGWTEPAARAAAWFLAPADPLRRAGQIAPRPVLVQNGRRDRLIPTAAAQALYDALREPKDIIWYDSDHVGLDEAHTRQVLRDALAWLAARDAEFTE